MPDQVLGSLLECVEDAQGWQLECGNSVYAGAQQVEQLQRLVSDSLVWCCQLFHDRAKELGHQLQPTLGHITV